MATTKNLCAQIPIALHERVSEERERLGETASEYIANLIQEYYNMIENQKGGIQVTEKGRTMAFQIPEELFQRIKRHLERETLRTGKKLTQRDFVLNLITQALDEADAESAAEQDFPAEASFIIGLAQACAVMPGLSRSGSTIATGLILGNKKETLAQFSFLMVIPPILGEALLSGFEIVKGAAAADAEMSIGALTTGFLAAFISGCVACKWMINIVKKGKLVWFGVYCAIAGAITIVTSLLG